MTSSPVKIWRNQKKIAASIGKTGTILSWTVVWVPPGGFTDQAPYPVVLVRLDDGGRMAAQLVDYSEKQLQFGQKVITVVRKTIQSQTDDVIPYGIKVRPL